MHTEEQSELTAHLLDLDQARCAAINAGDIEALGQLMHQRLSHVHQTGRHNNRTEFLSGIAERPRRVERRDIHVDILKEMAIMTGVQINTFPDQASVAFFVTQVWVREPQGWLQVSFHCCRLTHGLPA